MMRQLIIIGHVVFFAGLSILRAEIEVTSTADGYTVKKKVEFPILISLRDSDNRPVKGAIVALNELGLSFSTDEEMIRAAKSRTDENGMILIMHPAMALENTPNSFTIKMQSAITIVAKGHPTVTLSLGNYFKESTYTHSESTAPNLKVLLADQATGHTKSEKKPNKAEMATPRKPSD